MYMLKLLFQKLQIDKVHPGSWENSRPPGALLTITAWGQVETSAPLCSRELQQTTCPWEQLTAQNKNSCCSFFCLILPELQNPSPHSPLFIPCYKNLGLERKCETVLLGVNPPSSQIASHLNKAFIKIQSLSLFIGFCSDRQPKRPCLFWFQNHMVFVSLFERENTGIFPCTLDLKIKTKMAWLICVDASVSF